MCSKFLIGDSVCLSIYLSFYLSNLSAYISIHPSVHFSIYLTCLYAYISILPIYLSIYPSIHNLKGLKRCLWRTGCVFETPVLDCRHYNTILSLHWSDVTTMAKSWMDKLQPALHIGETIIQK
jgi:hypothetical protein